MVQNGKELAVQEPEFLPQYLHKKVGVTVMYQSWQVDPWDLCGQSV